MPPEQQNREQSAAMISEIMRVLHKSDSNIVAEILATHNEFREWDHLPAEDVHDVENASQFFYHAHAKSDDGAGFHDDEHGHFHLFLRRAAFAHDAVPEFTPADSSEPDGSTDGPGGDLTHVIGIGMNAYGAPIRLFTVNQWVTGDTWFNADAIIAALPHFQIDSTQPSWPLNLWISHMVRLVAPEIATLLKERDAAIAARKGSLDDRLEDRGLEVPSHREFNLEDYIRQRI